MSLSQRDLVDMLAAGEESKGRNQSDAEKEQ